MTQGNSMGNLIQCRQCGRPFRSAGGKLCPDCLEKVENGFRKLANYLSVGDARYDPNVNSIDELAEKTNTESWVVLNLLKEKRVTIHKPLEGGLTCRYCHKPIATGDACDDCKNSLAEQLLTPKTPKTSAANQSGSNKYGAR